MPRKKLKAKRKHLPDHGVISGSRYNPLDPRRGGSKRAADENRKEREERRVKDEMWLDEEAEEIRRYLKEVEIKRGRRRAEEQKAKEKASVEALKKRKALQIKKKKKK
tara:strand:+ start:1737 stop:2060 length:324 start_codon:yes stop_codon:yes gene_type:complete